METLWAAFASRFCAPMIWAWLTSLSSRPDRLASAPNSPAKPGTGWNLDEDALLTKATVAKPL